jgi:hypothetical protein
MDHDEMKNPWPPQAVLDADWSIPKKIFSSETA